jgi:tetratricopeptide (TPR) repeat protein
VLNLNVCGMGSNQSKLTTTATTTTNGGISFKLIMELTKQLKENDTMDDFVRKIIKPATKKRRESYFELLAKEQPSKVKLIADHFISHVWSYKTKSELMASLKYTLLDKLQTEDDDVYVWLDGLCVNQHQVSSTGTVATPQQLQQTFGESLKAIKSVVIVLSNWQNPSYTKRIWCVFEAYMTKKIPDIQVTLAMSSAEEQSLVDAMIENKISVEFLQTYFSRVDVESAKAKEPADEQAILQLIREFGVPDVNSVVLGNLKQWLVQGGTVALANVDENSVEAGKICMARYAIAMALGELDVALEWVEKTLTISIQVYGPENQEVATAYNNKAARLKDLGRLDDALVANEQAFTIYQKILGEEHPFTINSRSWKADILVAQGKFEEALVIFNEVLQSRRRILGENHPHTILAMAYRANCLADLEQFNEALPLYEEIIVISKRIYDGNHPEIASALNNKVQCLRQMGRPEEALPLCDQVISIYKKVYGEVHPEVASAIGNKALCLNSLGKINEALPLYDQALAIRIQVFGENHASVAATLNNKAFCLQSLGRDDEAKQLGKQALGIAERVLGSSHPQTIKYRERWGGS